MDAPPSRASAELRADEYQQVVGVVNLLTEVRFKLAAFVPALTTAAVALLVSADVVPFTQALFGLGGLAFVLGIVVYDLRNSQIYNGAIGRAQALEASLYDRYRGDSTPGLFGARHDSDAYHRARGTDRFLGLSVSHGTGLTIVYAATVAAWVWVLADAVAQGLREQGVEPAATQLLVAAMTVIAAAFFAQARTRFESPVPRPAPSSVVGVRLSREELDQVKRVASRHDVSHGDVIRRALAAGLPEDPGEDEAALEYLIAFEAQSPSEEQFLMRYGAPHHRLTERCERRVRAAIRRMP